MENHSFNHMLGWMKKSVNPNINGVTSEECNPASTKTQKPETICFTDDAEFIDPDPGHSFEAVAQQVFGYASVPSMTGFVEQALSISPNHVKKQLDQGNLRKLKYIFKFHQFDLKFKKDDRNGKPPSLTMIEPRYFDLKGLPANDDH
ncbi:hypothetical protein L484_002173 [Morus notabilis]|uniref:Uncharacterized protein n=1 Tax=Morus notabilis TaxID=981085 RepID=W9QIK9_9ROSA|nr:hypothetical protein L484_002173 [Morus notabilis]